MILEWNNNFLCVENKSTNSLRRFLLYPCISNRKLRRPLNSLQIFCFCHKQLRLHASINPSEKLYLMIVKVFWGCTEIRVRPANKLISAKNPFRHPGEKYGELP